MAPRSLIALILGLAGALSPAGPAQSAESCQGRPATIVGVGEVTGTEGPDVIVASGRRFVTVLGLGGDDVICATPGGDASVTIEAGDGDDLVVTGAGPDGTLTVHAGPGNDLVDTSAGSPRGFPAEIFLGTGNDQFLGGPGREEVYGSYYVGDRQADVISTGAGPDLVASGSPNSLNTDKIDLGPGRDTLNLKGRRAGNASTSGGPGRDTLNLGSRDRGHWRIDNRSGQAELDGTVWQTWTGFEGFLLADLRGPAVSFQGARASEQVRLGANATGANLRGGNDTLTIDEQARPRRGYRGGPGRNTLILNVHRTAPVVVDLASGRIDFGRRRHGRTGARLLYFTDTRLAGHHLVVRGTKRPNVLFVAGDQVTVVGRAGSDRISLERTATSAWRHRPPYRTVVRGGTGDDKLIGSARNDRLYGGRGKDRADGRRGIDRCRAEVRRSCELR